MQMSKLFQPKYQRSWFFLLISIFCLNAFAADSDPVAMLQTLANRMVTSLKENKATLKNNPQYVYALATKIVVPHANLPEMSKRVLPPAVWAKASAAQKAQFQKEFTVLLVQTYSSALAAYSNQTVRFYPIRGGYSGKSTVEVESDIVGSANPSIHVIYRLLKIQNRWDLYDMSVEGVSLIESFRSQFADMLSQGDMSALLKTLADHNNRT